MIKLFVMMNDSLYKIIGAAFLSGCIFLAGCENKMEEVTQYNKKAAGKDEVKKVVIKYSMNARKKALLTSPIMYRVQDTVPYVEFPNTLHVDFFDALGSIESKLDARYAKYRESQSIVYLRDSVRVINIKGDTLYCDELYWDRNRTGTEFYTTKPVRIRTRVQTINGIGMEARQDFKEWHILGSTGVIRVPSAEFPD